MKPNSLRIVLVRSSLLLMFAGCVALCGINVFKIRQKIITLENGLKTQTAARELAEENVATTKLALERTGLALQAMTTERNAAMVEAEAQRHQVETVTKTLATVRNERDTAKAELSRFELAGLRPEQIIAVATELKALKSSLAAANKKATALEAQLRDRQAENDPDPSLPAQLKAKVLVTDPKWGFVVLDAGREQGARKQGELLVSRDGKLVGKVKISSVENNQSIANIVSDWHLSEIHEGDVLIPAHPRS